MVLYAVVWWVSGVVNHHPIAILLALYDNQVVTRLDPQVSFIRRVRVLNHHNHIEYFRYKVRKTSGADPPRPTDRE